MYSFHRVCLCCSVIVIANLTFLYFCRLCYSGPLAHYFYSWLDQFIPKDVSYYAIKRIIADRFVIAPPYLLVFFYLLGLLEVRIE